MQTPLACDKCRLELRLLTVPRDHLKFNEAGCLHGVYRLTFSMKECATVATRELKVLSNKYKLHCEEKSGRLNKIFHLNHIKKVLFYDFVANIPNLEVIFYLGLRVGVVIPSSPHTSYGHDPKSA